MELTVSLQVECLLRLVFAAFCGALIGYERESHLKTAGIRTHLIVCMSASLMMIISKYAFFDIIKADGVGLDPSRVAAGAVTAIGFIGAGVIFERKQTINGLTTAAGIWATVGVGTAIGGGLYVIGLLATGMILLAHFIFHRNSRFVKTVTSPKLILQMDMSDEPEKMLTEIFAAKRIDIISLKIKRLEETLLELHVQVQYPNAYEVLDIMALLREIPSIKSIEM